MAWFQRESYKLCILQPEFYEGENFLSERFCQAAVPQTEPVPPPQPGAGQLGALGQPQPWASSTSSGMAMASPSAGRVTASQSCGYPQGPERFSTEIRSMV